MKPKIGIIPNQDNCRYASRPEAPGPEAAVKVQYLGDVNDYRKFALLRLLSEVGRFKIGVCWMLTEPDGSGQGAKRRLPQATGSLARLRP